MSPLQIQQKIVRLSRLLRDLLMRYTIAYLADDCAEARRLGAEAHEIRFEILRLKRAYQAEVSLRSEQAAAVAEACRIMGAVVDTR